MAYDLTPGAARAMAAAGRWRLGSSDRLETPQMLIGLVAEPECRAAVILNQHQVDESAIRSRWPELTVNPAQQAEADSLPSDGLEAWQLGRQNWSVELAAAMDHAEQRLFEYPRPLELATEHVLLGLAVLPGQVSTWLEQRGLRAEELEAEIHRLAGHVPGPLDWSDAGPVEQPVVESDSGFGKNAGGLAESERIGAFRIADAAANRAGEGLRVIEDYLRFVLDDRHLTALCKSLRHDFAEALSALPAAQRHTARETQADVGTDVTTSGETQRAQLSSIVVAAFKRVQQSLRSLEEIAKLADAVAAQRFERLRYRSYTLERAVDITRSSLDRLANARLYVLVDGRASEQEFRRLVLDLVQAGVNVLQLRDKQLADRELLGRARIARELTGGTSTLLIINDRPDLAALCRADGVHVGQDEFTVKDARTIVGPQSLVGVSTHSIEQARQAVLDGANYIGVGPTFPSQTKQFSEFTGLELLRQVAGEISLPAFAIGGIDQSNVPVVLQAGANRVAVSGAVVNSTQPGTAAKSLRSMLRAD